MSAPIKLTFGDTLLLEGTYRDNAGTPVNLTTAGITVEAKIHSPNGLKSYAIPVTIKDQTTDPGEFTINKLTSEFASEPGGVWKLRLTYVSSQGRFSADPVCIELVQ